MHGLHTYWVLRWTGSCHIFFWKKSKRGNHENKFWGGYCFYHGFSFWWKFMVAIISSICRRMDLFKFNLSLHVTHLCKNVYVYFSFILHSLFLKHISVHCCMLCRWVEKTKLVRDPEGSTSNSLEDFISKCGWCQVLVSTPCLSLSFCLVSDFDSLIDTVYTWYRGFECQTD